MYNITEFPNSGWEELRFEILETALGAGWMGTYGLIIDTNIVDADSSLCGMFGLEFSTGGTTLELFGPCCKEEKRPDKFLLWGCSRYQ